MFKIEKDFHFHAGHRLVGLVPGHKCSRLHGHTYHVKLCFQSMQLDSAGMVMDYAEIGDLVHPMLEKFDHRTFLCKSDPLVEVLRKAGESESLTVLADNPTAEVIAKIVYDGVAFALDAAQTGGSGEFNPDLPIKLSWVEVKESEGTASRYG